MKQDEYARVGPAPSNKKKLRWYNLDVQTDTGVVEHLKDIQAATPWEMFVKIQASLKNPDIRHIIVRKVGK